MEVYRLQAPIVPPSFGEEDRHVIVVWRIRGSESERDRWVDDEPGASTQAWSAPLVVEPPPTWAVGPETGAPEDTPAPFSPGSGSAPEEGPGEDRSLRELFWGED